MQRIKPNESPLIGKWIELNGSVIADEVCSRIEWALSNQLTLLEAKNWEGIYVDDESKQRWKLTYPDSHLHGGGPPRLDAISQWSNCAIAGT